MNEKNESQRIAAANAGETKYSTGYACRRGHFSSRYTSTGACCECMKNTTQRQRAYLRRALKEGRRRRDAEITLNQIDTKK